MDIPGTIGQLAVALFLITPGVVYQVTRSRFRGPTPDDASATNRILRALGFSAGLNGLYAIVAGPQLYHLVTDTSGEVQGRDAVSSNLRSLGWWFVLLYLAVPAALAVLGVLTTKYGPRLRRFRLFEKWPRLSYDPTPRAWDYAFSQIHDGAKYIRINVGDRWFGGYFGSESFISSYPEPYEVYIEKGWLLDTDGGFVDPLPDNAGMFVRCDDARAIEFINLSADAGSTVDTSSQQDGGAA